MDSSSPAFSNRNYSYPFFPTEGDFNPRMDGEMETDPFMNAQMGEDPLAKKGNRNLRVVIPDKSQPLMSRINAPVLSETPSSSVYYPNLTPT
jgi:hypothetical protein